MLALGDLDRPGSLADVLDDDPNLAMTVRPSLEYRLGDAWRADPSRRGFWHLALRLASMAEGHLLAASEAARVAALQMNDIADLAPLADAATGAATDSAGRWGFAEARLPVLPAGRRHGARLPPEAMACIDALTCDLARQARTADDVDLALAGRAATGSRRIHTERHSRWPGISMDRSRGYRLHDRGPEGPRRPGTDDAGRPRRTPAGPGRGG